MGGQAKMPYPACRVRVLSAHLAAAQKSDPYDDDDAQQLPLFACGVAFPTCPFPLQVFEPRYRALVQRCVDHALPGANPTFGVVAVDANGLSEWGTVDQRLDVLASSEQGILTL